MRVLATFPELVQAPARAGVDGPASTGKDGPTGAAVAPTGPARTIRVTPRPRLPVASIVALGLIAAAIWTLVAARERTWPDREPTTERLAVEPGPGTGGTRR